jgi:hypothetical protein
MTTKPPTSWETVGGVPNTALHEFLVHHRSVAQTSDPMLGRAPYEYFVYQKGLASLGFAE